MSSKKEQNPFTDGLKIFESGLKVFFKEMRNPKTVWALSLVVGVGIGFVYGRFF